MKSLLSLSLIIIASGCLLHGQSVTVSGTVTNELTGEPVSNVMVSIRAAGENRILRYTITTTDGKYDLSLASVPENHVLHFAMMSYAPLIIPLEEGRRVYDAQLSMQSTELKEVRFKAPDIDLRGDTVTYHVENFADIQDKTLADVLKKMPGITVETSGQIKYNDVSINKFYIEGKDMLGGRYGMATNNINQNDVSRVEVMENHQPIKALEDISFSQNPAINIRLREDAKARWVGTLKPGAGLGPLLWKSELAGMRFKAKAQTLNVYKTNNTGDGLANQTRAFAMGNPMAGFSKGYGLRSYISAAPDNLRTLDDTRSRFNKTHLFSTNNLWSLGGDYDLTSQFTYFNEQLTFDNATRTSYFLEDGTLVTEEAEHASSGQNRLQADMTFTANTRSNYFKNKLYADVGWNETDISVGGTYPNRQTASTPYRKVSNDLEIIKRFGNKAYTLNSYNLWQTKPQQIAVERGEMVQRQQVSTAAFYTNTNTALSFFLNPVNISMSLGVVGVLRSLESQLTGVADTLGRLNNDEAMRYLNLFVSPSMEYKKGKIETTFSMPLSFIPYRYYDKIAGSRQHQEKFFLSPRLSVRYHLTSRLIASASGSYTQSPLQEQSFHEGLILNNYRNLSQGITDFQTGNSKSVSLNIRYRDPLRAVFGGAGYMQSWNYSPYTSGLYFLDSFLLNTYTLRDNNNTLQMVSANVSKGMDIIKGLVTLRSSLSTFGGAMFQNGKESPYSTDSWSISPKINSRIATWCNVSYELSFSRNWMKMKNTGLQTSYDNLLQKASATISPGKRWMVQVMSEHYYNEITANDSRHFFLADAGVTYSFINGVELNLSVKNIFNQNLYSYTTYSGLRAMSKEYTIRPRNVMASVFFRF